MERYPRGSRGPPAKGLDRLKSVRGFESLPLRHMEGWPSGRWWQSRKLLRGNPPWVRIPLLPPLNNKIMKGGSVWVFQRTALAAILVICVIQLCIQRIVIIFLLKLRLRRKLILWKNFLVNFLDKIYPPICLDSSVGQSIWLVIKRSSVQIRLEAPATP